MAWTLLAHVAIEAYGAVGTIKTFVESNIQNPPDYLNIKWFGTHGYVEVKCTLATLELLATKESTIKTFYPDALIQVIRKDD